MNTIGNIIWWILGGLETALYWFLMGCLFSITIVGIPLGRVSFRLAKLSLEPFGKNVNYGGSAPSLVANVVWIIFAGLPMALSYFFLGCLYSITIIGIPWGKQCFKMAKLSLMPFGASILKN